MQYTLHGNSSKHQVAILANDQKLLGRILAFLHRRWDVDTIVLQVGWSSDSVIGITVTGDNLSIGNVAPGRFFPGNSSPAGEVLTSEEKRPLPSQDNGNKRKTAELNGVNLTEPLCRPTN